MEKCLQLMYMNNKDLVLFERFSSDRKYLFRGILIR